MDGGEAEESAVDGEVVPTRPMIPDVSCMDEWAQPAKKRQMTESDSVDKGAAQQEMDGLLESYKEVSGHQLNPEELGCSTDESIVACLLEESSLPYTKLVDEIYEKMKLRDGVTPLSVGSSVLRIGHRSWYGIPCEKANVLEDQSDLSLWCWETGDLILLPSHLHEDLLARRKARKMIHQRIIAVLATLEVPGNQKIQSVNVQEALNLDGIRAPVKKKMKQMNESKMGKKERKIKEKQQAILERQVRKEHVQKEKELNCMKEDAEKEAKRVEREKTEQHKELKKHQKKAEWEQKRRQKEQTELKKQAAIQKQASMMECFLKSNRSNNNVESTDNSPSAKTPIANSSDMIERLVSAATLAMDRVLSQASGFIIKDIKKSSLARWRKLSQLNILDQWGVRRSPKIKLIKELKLQKSSEAATHESVSAPMKESSFQMDNPFIKKKLLQFDTSNRPPYYGTWTKKSCMVGPRRPNTKDPCLDYKVDSDEEWEEEDPGESLSGCEKDDEENMKEDNSEVDEEEEAEDSFVVRDGYLLEDEGVPFEPPSGKLDEISSFLSIPGVADEELCVLREQQKVLCQLTEEALKKDKPLLISNLNQEIIGLIRDEDLIGIVNKEQLCLQALRMREYTAGPIIDVPTINLSTENQDICGSNNKGLITPVSSAKAISDPDLTDFVKKDTVDRFGFSLSPGKGGKQKDVTLYFSKRCKPLEVHGKSAESFPQPGTKSEVGKDQTDGRELGGNTESSIR